MNLKFDCQICSWHFFTVREFKQHLLSFHHKQQYNKFYPKDIFRRNTKSFTPWIFFKDLNTEHSKPLLGLSQMTLCFCSSIRNSFILCHVCEEKFHDRNVVRHLSDINHFSSYFAYTDPNALSFAIVHSENDICNSLKERINNEEKKRGSGNLKVLHMPETLFQECSSKSYCQVMFLLHQNQSLSSQFTEIRLQKMSIQAYKDDSNRKHPLLGLQYIVESVCIPHSHLKDYLCTLCSLHIKSSLIIRHLLSREHISGYLKIWHPSTDYTSGTLTDFAKRSEELCGHQEIQQVKLTTSQMMSVFYQSFKKALSQIESIANKGSLIPTVQPGEKHLSTLHGSHNMPTAVKEETISEPVPPENTIVAQNNEEKKEETHSATPAASSYSFDCQNCNKNFETNDLYCNHVSSSEHQENLIKTFGAVVEKGAGECKPHFHTYKYFTENNFICVGVPVVVTILSHELEDEPVHLCFACEMVLSNASLMLHMNAERHIVQTLMYYNPWKLPFAWTRDLHCLTLKLDAREEEREKGLNTNIKILDVPSSLFPCRTTVTYSKVMEKLSQYHSLLMNGVPQCETFSRRQDNETFPLLGCDFLVKYGLATSGWKYLCLLCQCPLSSDHYSGHVFSSDHVVAFLKKFHPGSLNVNTTNEELLDLAKQAARIHPVSNAQEIEFDPYQCKSVAFDNCNLSTKVRLLTAQKANDGKGPLMPSLTPSIKLFPRQQSRERNLDSETKESNTVTKVQSIPGKIVQEPLDDFQSADQESHITTEISLKEIQKLPTEVKEERDLNSPSEASQLEVINSAKSCSSEFLTDSPLKRRHSQSDMDTSDSDMEHVKPKRGCLSNPEEEKEAPNLQITDKTKVCNSSDVAVADSVACYGSLLRSFIQKRDRPPVIGLNAVYECVFLDHSPIYLCECCRLIFKEPYFCNHLKEVTHYEKYLCMAGNPPRLRGGLGIWSRNMTNLARDWEKTKGYGETKVVKLLSKDYEKLKLPCDYFQALKIVKTHVVKKASIISPVLHENSAKTVTTSKQESTQQDMSMETEPEHLATSSTTMVLTKSEIASKSLKESNSTSSPEPEFTSISMSTPAVTHPATSTSSSAIVTSDAQQMTSAKLVDEVTGSNPLSDVHALNAIKEGSDQQSKSILPDALPKREEESAVVETVMLTNNVSTETATSRSSSNQTNTLSAASATFIPKTADSHDKSKGNQLKPNVNAALQAKNDNLMPKSASLTPTTSPHIGLDQLVKLKYQEKRLVFCLACQTSLEGSNHLTSMTHQINCVKIKFPWWRPNPGEEELSKMVALVHDDEKAAIVEKIDVPFDVYKEIKRLPNDEAMQKVRGLLKKKCSKRLGEHRPSVSTSEASSSKCDTSTSPMVSFSPSDITSPNPGKVNYQTNAQPNSQPMKKLPVSPLPSCPVQKPTSKVAPRIIEGSTTDNPSTLSHILTVKNISVIGVCFVWECRVVPQKHNTHNSAFPTFYLCEVCSLTISISEICEHMVSTEHQFKYLMKQYPQFMYWVGEELCLLPSMTNELTNLIADCVKDREESMDAQTVLLSEEYFEMVRKAPFVEALNVVRRIKQEKKTTNLPIVFIPQEEELREQHMTQPTVNTSNTLTDDPSQMEISFVENACEITQSDHTENEDSTSGEATSVTTECCPGHTDTDIRITVRRTELLYSAPQSPTSTNVLKQPESPFSPSSLILAESPYNENQEHFEPDSKPYLSLTSPVRDDLAVVDITETASLLTLEDTCTDDKIQSDIQVDAPSLVQEPSTESLNLIEDNKTVEEDQMPKECSTEDHSDANEESASLMARPVLDHNSNESPAVDTEDEAALDKHYCMLLIDFIKDIKKQMISTSSTSEVCETESPQNNKEHSEAQQCTTRDKEPPKTDTDVAGIQTGPTVLQSQHLTSSTCITNQNIGKPTSVNVIPFVSDNLQDENLSELVTQQSEGQLVQSKHDEPLEESKVPEQMQLSEIKVQEEEEEVTIKMDNSVPDSQVLMQSQIEIQVTQTKCQYHSAGEAEIQQSLCQASHQTQNLPLKSDTQHTFSQNTSDVTPGLRKDLNSDSGAVDLQTQQTDVQENQNLVSQPKTLVVPTQHEAKQTQIKTGQMGMKTLSTHPRPHILHFKRNGKNTNLQPSSTMRENSQFGATSYLTNGAYSNTPAMYDSVYPSLVHHHQQAQQYYASMQPYLQISPPPDVSGWFSANTPHQGVAQNYLARPNGTVAGTSNAAYAHGMVPNQRYTHNNRMQFNRVFRQNPFHASLSAPNQPNFRFFPHRQ